MILGSGFDSRSHRLDALNSVEVYEIDFAPLLDLKRRVLESAGA